MTARDSMLENHDCGGDAAAYVLGALDRAEAEAFEQHLSSCVVCRDEVATLSKVADALPMAAPQYAAPKELRRRMMQEVRAESSTPKARRRWPVSLSVMRPAVAAGFAVVLALVVIGAVLLANGGSSGTEVFRASTGNAEVRVSGDRGELIVHQLPAPGAGRIYEVWLKRPGQAPAPTSTLFSVTSNGRGEIGLPGSLKGVDAILVTSEPAGGSQAPTRAPVIINPV
jgi:anti-sigma-K factor RskA